MIPPQAPDNFGACTCTKCQEIKKHKNLGSYAFFISPQKPKSRRYFIITRFTSVSEGTKTHKSRRFYAIKVLDKREIIAHLEMDAWVTQDTLDDILCNLVGAEEELEELEELVRLRG